MSRPLSPAPRRSPRCEDPAIGVAILDVQLPDLNGLEVFRRLRELRPDLRVIILSAHTDQEYVLEALRLGACDYLAKPIHEEELALAVRRALETYELGAEWHRLRDRLHALEGALDRLWAGDGEGALPEAAARAAAEVLAATKASLLLLDEQRQELRVAGAHGRAITVDEMSPVPVGGGIAGQALSRAEPVLVDDITRDPRFAAHGAPGRYDSGSFAMAPVAVGDERLGVLCVTDRAGGQPFDEDDLALLPHPAPGRCRAPAAAGGRPRPRPLSRPPPKRSPRSGGEDAELARAVCEAVTGEVEPGRLLAAALRPLAAALHAAPVSIYLSSPEGLVREAEWDGGTRSDRERLPAGRGLTGAVAQSGQLVASARPDRRPALRRLGRHAGRRRARGRCSAARCASGARCSACSAPSREAAGAASARTGEVLVGGALRGGPQRAPVP